MKLRQTLYRRDSLTSLVVGGVLLILLPLLAALQYNWLGQVSEGEREQKRASLRLAASRISEDFDVEITRAYASFVVGANELDDEDSYAEKYQRWLSSSKDARLIKAVYLVAPQANDVLTLKQYDTQTNKFAAQDWPTEFHNLHEQLDQRVKVIRRLFTQPLQEPPRPPSAMQSLNADLPALTIPIVDFPPREARTIEPRFAGFVVITLDRQLIQQEILPALVRRHFPHSDVVNYELAIVGRGQGKPIIWQSSAAAFSNPDVTQLLFGIRPDEFRQLRNRFQQPGTPPLRTRGMIPMGEDNKAWELWIRHREGSLEAAVAKVRRRNLVISSIILLILVVSVTLLMLSLRRARKLAQQQMDFVAGVSHELRTPLAVIDSAGYNIAKGVVKDPQRIVHYGLLIRKETRRLQEMVEQILEFAGVQSGRQKYELHPTAPGPVIHEVLASFQPLLAESQFELETKIAADLPTVMADAGALSRALQNLINNAMKYSGDSRWIGVEARVTGTGKSEEVQIKVADHGLGISAEDQAHIFEPFYRASEVKAAQIRGNGLGLNLVKSIVAAHNGRVMVESTEGKGSVFTISLPVVAKEVLQASMLESRAAN